MKSKPLKLQEIAPITIRSPIQLGNAIRRLRRLLGMSQTELGQKTGITQATISRLEKGTQNAEPATLFVILSALNADLTITSRPKSNTTDDLEGLM